MDAASKHTLTYKVVNGTAVKLDLFVPRSTSASAPTTTDVARPAAADWLTALTAHIPSNLFGWFSPKNRTVFDPKARREATMPLLVFWHGGGLTALSKEFVPKWLFNDALDAGFAVISANYSLLSPATAHDILADLKDLYGWVNTSLNAELASLGSPLVDLDRTAVAGASAGGYLAYLSAIHAEPKPRVVLSLYGMGGDMLTDHYVVPKTEPFLGVTPITGYPRTFQPLIKDGAPFRKLETSTEQLYEAGAGEILMARLAYGAWQVQTATALEAMTGIAGVSKRLAAVPYAGRAAAFPVEARELFPQLTAVTKASPPMLIIHGEQDTTVLPEESQHLKARYDAAGASCELVWIPDQDHAFEWQWTTAKDGLERAVPFLMEHTKQR